MNAQHSPSPTALWWLTLAVLVAHLWLLKGGLSELVLAPGASTVATLATVHLQSQAPQAAASARPVRETPPTKPPTKPQTKPQTKPPTTSQASTSATPELESVAPTALGEPTPTNTSVDHAPPSSVTTISSASESDEDAPDSIATTKNPKEPAGPRITEAGSFPPVAVPEPLKLLYQLQGQAKGFNYSAKGELLWLPAGQRYEARLEISAFLLGSRVQTSRGEITANGLQPQRFSDKVRSEVAAHFDWAQRQVIFSANTPKAELQNGAQDHLSAFIALAALLGGDLQRYLPDGEITLQAIGPREADVWRVQMNGEETLSLPAGKLTTYKLTRPPVKPYDLNVELWMAPSLGFLPARIRLTQHNGDFIDQLLQSSSRP